MYDISGVQEVVFLGLNRKLTLDKIYELVEFDKELVLNELNNEFAKLEENSIKNDIVVDFIKNNLGKYIFFTNTSLPKKSLNRVMESIETGNYFKELLAFEDGSKIENVNYVLEKYNLSPKEVLFIDDNINHIERVKVTGVNTLHFKNYGIDIEKEIEYMKNLT